MYIMFLKIKNIKAYYKPLKMLLMKKKSLRLNLYRKKETKG